MPLRKSSFLGVSWFGSWAIYLLATTTSSTHAFSILSTRAAAAAAAASTTSHRPARVLTTRLSSNNGIDAANDTTATTTTATTTTIESLTVSALPDDHEQVGQELAESIQRWLDAEWMPQDIHLEMGLSVKASYVKCRVSGHEDLMMIMTTIVDDLMEDWHTVYDDSAFVNAYEIGNYASDYLTKKQGIDGCECSAEIY